MVQWNPFEDMQALRREIDRAQPRTEPAVVRRIAARTPAGRQQIDVKIAGGLIAEVRVLLQRCRRP